MLFFRSRVDEALPVVTGRSDNETAAAVFGNWRQDPILLERFNVFAELTAARGIRDRVLSRFLLKPGHLVRLPDEPGARQRAQKAQIDIAQLLANERRWGRHLIDNYLGTTLSDDVWDLVFAGAVA